MITLIHPNIDPVILSFGGISIRWYGLLYAVSLILGILLIKKININCKIPIKNKIVDDFFIWGALGIILGARIGYVIFYQFFVFLENPLYIFYIWKGGMSFHGGLLGIIFSIALFSNIKKINFLFLSDLVSTVAPIGLFLGRIANFINGELYGRTTSFIFAYIYPKVDSERRHPSQLYEAFFEGLIIFIILILLIKNNLQKNIFGISTSIFLILYGTFRFFLEYLREPDHHIGFIYKYFTIGQLLSLPLILLGFYILFFKINNDKTQK